MQRGGTESKEAGLVEHSILRARKPRYWGIRQFIVLWISAVLLAFLLLCGGLQYAIARQQSKTSRIFAGSQSLQVNRAFEAAIIAEGRQDLLWKTTGNPRYLVSKDDLLRNADTLLDQLKSQADSQAEAEVIRTIETRYSDFRRQFLAAVPSETEPTQRALDAVLLPLGQHRLINQQQMDATMRDAKRIDKIVDVVATSLVMAATLLVLAGGLELWKRIFKPTLLLAQAAREFSVDLHARAPVLRNDEMGTLGHTFNRMADAICDREKDRLHFVATVAHDLRNPLVVIGGAAHLLKSKDARLAPEERQRWLGNIGKNAHTLEVLIEDLMDGVQAETGELHFDMEQLDLTALVREVTEEHAESDQSHLVRHELASDCHITGDRKRLQRVLMNLLSNATKYSANGREIFVTLELRPSAAILRVSDEGAGIPAEDLPKLFQPFSRLEHTKKMATGTGLGLSSVKKIIEGHGGSVGIESVLGAGTTVKICLPLEQAIPELG